MCIRCRLTSSPDGGGWGFQKGHSCSLQFIYYHGHSPSHGNLEASCFIGPFRLAKIGRSSRGECACLSQNASTQLPGLLTCPAFALPGIAVIYA